MKRFETDGRVIYVRRNRRPSLACLLAGAAVAALLGSYAKPDERLPLALGYSLPFWAGAFLFLFREEVFIIDPVAGTLRIRERRYPGALRERLLPLQGAEIRITSATTTLPLVEIPEGRLQWIWIDIPRHGRILFQGPLREPEQVRDCVEILRTDLGPPQF